MLDTMLPLPQRYDYSTIIHHNTGQTFVTNTLTTVYFCDLMCVALMGSDKSYIMVALKYEIWNSTDISLALDGICEPAFMG